MCALENKWEREPINDRTNPGAAHTGSVTVVFAGTHNLMSVRLAAHLATKIAALPTGSVILLRRGRTTAISTFEGVVAELAKTYDIRVEWREPQPGDRSMVYRRDYQMIDDADYVEAYFPASQIMEGGTGHIVDASLNRDKRVYAWSVTMEGYVERIGELEPTSIDGYPSSW